MKYSFVALILTTLCIEVAIAQQDAQYTQYMYNTLVVNPAYAGSRGVFSASVLHRSQWVGLNGAPTTQTLSIHAPMKKKLGVGFSVINDEIGNGTSQETYVDGVVSYSIRLASEAKLSFGIKASAHLLNVDFSKLSGFSDETGVGGIQSIDNKLSPNFGTGIYYHSDKFYLGVSIPNFLQTQHFENSSVGSSFLAKERMNIYLITGYVYEINPDFKIKPAILIKAVNGAPLQTDFSTTMLFNNQFSFGVAYRWDAAFSAFTGFQITDQFLLGLAYDREITELGNTSFNDGSFEIFIRYELFKNARRVVTPRFF